MGIVESIYDNAVPRIVGSIYSSPIAAWTPANIATAGWYDASDASTITESAGLVSQWNDKSGNSRTATQATGANQPTTNATTQNSLNVLDFDGSNDFFGLGTGLDWIATNSEDGHSAFIVNKTTTYKSIYGAQNGNSGANSLHVGYSNSSNYVMNYWGNDYGPAITGAFDSGAHNILGYEWDEGANKTIYANGNLEGSGGSPAGTIGTMSGEGRISGVVGDYHGGTIAEIVMVEGILSQADREKMEGYLAHKWGLTASLVVGHPYITTAPTV